MDAKRLIPALRRGTTSFELLLVASTAAITAASTYLIASKRIEAKYALRIDEEIEATRKFYAAFHEKPSPAELVEELGIEKGEDPPDVPAELLQQYAGATPPPATDPRPDLEMNTRGALTQYNRIELTPPVNDDGPAIQLNLVVEPPSQNIFEGGFSTDTVPQELVNERTGDRPYIISRQEFEESEFPQDSMEFYADDKVLADTQSEVVDDVEGLVGLETLESFGIGSGDMHVVYVHNPRTGMDFEIVRNMSSYGVVVHGLTKEE